MQYNTYIQQIKYDGINYTKGGVVDLLKVFNIVCQEFPFVKNPKPKELPKREWAGVDGTDVYIPDVIPVDSYEIEVDFMYVGTEATIRTDISNFIDFIYGRKSGSENDPFKSGRLAVYNEYTGIGRKDVVVSEIIDELFYLAEYDEDAMAKFKVKFTVYDPTTEVKPVYETYSGNPVVTQLNF